MNKLEIKSIKGMHDCLPNDIYIYQYVEKIFRILIKSYCFQEIRFPILERTSLFSRSLGVDSNLFINKEMYSFIDRNGLNISLRPEGTIGCVRAYLQNNLFLNNFLNKFWYLGPMFRYENTQKGRFRQFYQIGVEVFGAKNISVDLELILIIKKLWEKLGILDVLTLEINSIGSIEDRNKYFVYMKNFLKNKKDKIIFKNINFNKINFFRLLNSKNKKIKIFFKNFPKIINFINSVSLFNFKKLCKYLNILGVNYKINYDLVRGLDYYNDFVFEWTSNYLGNKKSICSGGRYDNLISCLSKFNIPAIGFAIGLDRLVMLLNQLNKNKFIFNNIDVYIISSFNNESRLLGIKIVEKILNYFSNSIIVYNDYIKYKNLGKKISKVIKLNPRIVIIIDKNEIINDYLTIKSICLNKQKKILYKDIINNIILFLK